MDAGMYGLYYKNWESNFRSRLKVLWRYLEIIPMLVQSPAKWILTKIEAAWEILWGFLIHYGFLSYRGFSVAQEVIQVCVLHQRLNNPQSWWAVDFQERFSSRKAVVEIMYSFLPFLCTISLQSNIVYKINILRKIFD